MPLRRLLARNSWNRSPPKSVTCCAICWRPAPPISRPTWASSNSAWHCTANSTFARDRLIWDTGHQIYPHKLVTGRYHEFAAIRTAGGLMGYPNPHESEYDLFMTGHAGCSVSTAVGLRSGDVLNGQADRRTVAVIGDGAFPSGIVFEAMNNAGELNDDLTIILNDNKMSICPRVGARRQLSGSIARQSVLHGSEKRSRPVAGTCADVWRSGRTIAWLK